MGKFASVVETTMKGKVEAGFVVSAEIDVTNSMTSSESGKFLIGEKLKCFFKSLHCSVLIQREFC
jgi:hypothetical protein